MTALSSLFHSLTVREWLTAACDILIVYYVIYRTLLLIKGTRAAQMLIGIVLVGAGFFAAKLLELTTLSWLLDNLINYAIIFFIVIFQHDIRRGLMRVGQNLFAFTRPYEQTFVFEEVIKATERLATSRVGALIVLEREADLVDYLNEPGVEMDAKVSEELLVSLFLPDSENKLHDGAVIIKNLRIAQAGAVLPLSANARLDKALGTRHRAAIGVTEETDSVVVVVSEERGSISLCFGGNIARDLDSPTLRKALLGLFQKQKRRTTQPVKPKEREMPPALEALPFERPLAEVDSRPSPVAGAEPAAPEPAEPARPADVAREKEAQAKPVEG
jgi:uncharacterized protein (TIGR00159 family)